MMALIAIVLLPLLAFQGGDCKQICQSPSCVEAATNVLNSMNKTFDPCNNFYEFACRGWMNKNPLPRGRQSMDPMSMITNHVMGNLQKIVDAPDQKGDKRPIKLARSLYRNCMDLESIERLGKKPLHDIFKMLGLPTSPPSDRDAAKIDIPMLIGRIYRYLDLEIFVRSSVHTSSADTTKRNLLLNQPKLLITDMESGLMNPSEFANLLETLRNFVKMMLSVAGARDKSEEYSQEFLKFMLNLAKGMKPPSTLGSGSAHKLSINTLQKITDSTGKYWNWVQYLGSIFHKTDIVINAAYDSAVMFNEDYFQHLASVIRTSGPGATVRVIWIWLLLILGPQTTGDFRKLDNRFKNAVYGSTKTQEPRSYKCTKLVNKHFDIALTIGYVEKHFTVQEKKKAVEMWNDVSASFDDMLNEIQWMDSRTKSAAHRKLHAMKAFIGFPDWITNAKQVEKYYERYQVLEGRLLETEINLKFIEVTDKMNSLKQTSNREKWADSALSVNAYYMPSMNSVTIPAAILHIPFYGSGVEALNYGAIGAVMGHELTHGFDNHGRLFDEKGVYRNWWSKGTLQHYLQQVRCMINQYTGFSVAQLGNRMRVNGEQTQGENIADNGGLTEALRAYKKLKARSKAQPGLPGLDKYTDDQLFFIGYSQMWCGLYSDAGMQSKIQGSEHPPNLYRVMGSLQNNAEFANAWKCPRGSPMNPQRKCVVW